MTDRTTTGGANLGPAEHPRGDTTMKVETYTLVASNGRKIRTATQVVLASGRVIRFTERLTKREAIKCAQYQLEQEDK